MPKEIKNSHTILVRVDNSSGDSGEGTIVCGHPETYQEHTPNIRTPWLRGRDIGGHYVMNCHISMVSRRFMGITSHGFAQDEGEAIGAFLQLKQSKLVEEFEISDKQPIAQVDKDVLQKWKDMIVGFTPPSKNVTPDTDDISKSGFFVSQTDRNVLNVVRKIAERQPAKVMMVGASGYGKSSIPQQMASEWNMKFLRVDCPTVTDQEEFFGYRGIKDGDTMLEDGTPIFNPSPFTTHVQEGNCVIVLDELNRIDPYIQNVLFPLLDHAGKTTVANHDIVVGKNVIFFATVNIGYRFTGTFQIDSALTNRFTISIRVGALPDIVEARLLSSREGLGHGLASDVVNFMTRLREMNNQSKIEIDASTRMSLQLASLISAGLDPKTSVMYCICNKVDENQVKLILDAYNTSFGE